MTEKVRFVANNCYTWDSNPLWDATQRPDTEIRSPKTEDKYEQIFLETKTSQLLQVTIVFFLKKPHETVCRASAVLFDINTNEDKQTKTKASYVCHTD